MEKWWMVRAGDNNELVPEWLKKQVATIGWSSLGNPMEFLNRDNLIEKAHEVYSKERPKARIGWGHQVWKFSREISVNDNIITYSKEKREYIIGKINKPYFYDPKVIHDYYPNVIGVKWESKRISRDQLSQGAKNSLGGISTVFRVDTWGDEFEGLLSRGEESPSFPTALQNSVDDESVDNTDFIQQAITLLEDAIDKLDEWQIQDLIGGLLESMGYKVAISPKGPDGGVDIIAHRDAFGFEKPIIKVQVKHRKATAGSPEIQQLLGSNPMGANCLFVSTGGFTSQAKNVAKQHGVKLVDLSELVQLVEEWYEKMPVERQSLLSLKKVYIPNAQ
ncbi:restriction endonuclease [Paenibacillus polymyxa]|uniref:restriction endonuclease n=1 Tax=Paenibacillus polymyxa TaxID=1406 RepID=UPI0025B635BA|nr:restriction endonuclease [Paenibacillus polymyxa]MDN4081417.1 restriction endonuclease [Paenibacillus polymyxa]MDN4109728.1 restriction endonuclease [Paenibacillus polymyxa]